jgi:hypothetical protein
VGMGVLPSRHKAVSSTYSIPFYLCTPSFLISAVCSLGPVVFELFLWLLHSFTLVAVKMVRFAFLTAGLVFASISVAAPIESQSDVVSVGATDRAQCVQQSCEIANLAGSTGQLPTIRPEGGDKNGYKVGLSLD